MDILLTNITFVRDRWTFDWLTSPLVGTDGHLTEFICEQTDRMWLLTTNVSEEGEGESQVTYRSSLPELKNVIKLIILI